MDKDVLFSVLIPVYNVQKFLSECIESVLRQKTKSRYEIILVDDGSKDNSSAICDDYAEKYSDKIKVFHKANGGLISARRAALKLAHGQYIVWLDSDDTLDDDYFAEIEKIIKSDDPDVMIFNFKKMTEDGRPINIKYQFIFDEGCVSKGDIYKKAVSSTSVNQLCRKVCKKELYDIDTDYSAYYHIQNGEDLIQSLPLFAKSNKFYYSKKAFYNYRINTNSLSRKVKPDQYKGLDIIRPMLYESMEKVGFATKENVQAFYSYYIKSIWETITDYVSASKGKLDYSVFEDIYNFKYVKKAYDYLPDDEKGLKLFYAKKWDELVRFAEKKCFVINLKKRIKLMIANIIY